MISFMTAAGTNGDVACPVLTAHFLVQGSVVTKCLECQ
jgi:hypothetical protein